MMNFNRNNLDKSVSPYLQQHKDNPINWQEWQNEVLDYAKKHKKLILVSVGYSTCHWCHVMAREAFSDKDVADYLNKYFVAIKVDREQRPDIDRYMMGYIIEKQGSGGWPLNIILSPDRKPILALTYAPVNPINGILGFIEILTSAKESYESKKNDIPNFSLITPQPRAIPEHLIISHIIPYYDVFFGGFGNGQKFPPHTTLIFLLYYYEKFKDPKVKLMIEKTLDKINLSGLHDHLQGGFFRYCTDREWIIPHFEKMLYDQALMLWAYSLAFKLFQKNEYKIVAEKLIRCIEETFEKDGLYYSAHDADTDHKEGETYLWDYEEIKKCLNKDEFILFNNVYEIEEKGNFNEKIHLIKKNNISILEIEKKLLKIRNNRLAPFIDKKINTSWNALLGIGLIFAYRCINIDKAKIKALELFAKLLEKHYKNGKIIHSSLHNNIQSGEFLIDYASVLLFATYAYEETGKYIDIIKSLNKKLNEFNTGYWIENKTEDFKEIPAETFDNPTPSSVSMADLASFRSCIILGLPYEPGNYKQPLYYDFFNYSVFLRNGHANELHINKRLPWGKIPINSMQIYSDKIRLCNMQRCNEFSSDEKLLDFLTDQVKA